jgi:hypothetical protein
VGLFNIWRASGVMWQEARGKVLRQHLDDAMARLKGANYPAMHGFYGNVQGTIEELREAYSAAIASRT